MSTHTYATLMPAVSVFFFSGAMFAAGADRPKGAPGAGRPAALKAARDRFYKGDIARDMAAFSEQIESFAHPVDIDVDQPGGDGGDTSYLCIIDQDRNVVSFTPSPHTGYGTCVAMGELGFTLNCRGDYFSLVPGHPNALVQTRESMPTRSHGEDLDGSVLHR